MTWWGMLPIGCTGGEVNSHVGVLPFGWKLIVTCFHKTSHPWVSIPLSRKETPWLRAMPRCAPARPPSTRGAFQSLCELGSQWPQVNIWRTDFKNPPQTYCHQSLMKNPAPAASSQQKRGLLLCLQTLRIRTGQERAEILLYRTDFPFRGSS